MRTAAEVALMAGALILYLCSPSQTFDFGRLRNLAARGGVRWELR